MAKKQQPGNGKKRKRIQNAASPKQASSTGQQAKSKTLITSSDTMEVLKEEIEAKRLAKLASLGMKTAVKNAKEEKKEKAIEELLPIIPPVHKQTSVRLTERSIFNQSTVAIAAGKKIV